MEVVDWEAVTQMVVISQMEEEAKVAAEAEAKASRAAAEAAAAEAAAAEAAEAEAAEAAAEAAGAEAAAAAELAAAPGCQICFEAYGSVRPSLKF